MIFKSYTNKRYQKKHKWLWTSCELQAFQNKFIPIKIPSSESETRFEFWGSHYMTATCQYIMWENSGAPDIVFTAFVNTSELPNKDNSVSVVKSKEETTAFLTRQFTTAVVGNCLFVTVSRLNLWLSLISDKWSRWSEREFEQTPLISTEVKDAWICIFTSAYSFTTWCFNIRNTVFP